MTCDYVIAARGTRERTDKQRSGAAAERQRQSENPDDTQHNSEPRHLSPNGLIATDCEEFLHLAQEGPAVWLVLPGFTLASSAAPPSRRRESLSRAVLSKCWPVVQQLPTEMKQMRHVLKLPHLGNRSLRMVVERPSQSGGIYECSGTRRESSARKRVELLGVSPML